MPNQNHPTPSEEKLTQPQDVGSTAAIQPDTKILPLLKQGFDLHSAGQLEAAALIYEQVLSIDPQNFQALQLFGVLSAQRQCLPQALALLTKALSVDATQPSTFNYHGNVLRALRRYEEALISYDSALKLRPDFAEAHDHRGATLYALGRYQEALYSHELAIQHQLSTADLFFNYGNALQALQRYTEALLNYDKAILLSPRDAQALNNRGVVLQRLMRYEEALLSYNKALSLSPNDGDAHNNKGLVLQALHQPKLAIESHRRALALMPDDQAALNDQGHALETLGQWEEALKCYTQLMHLNPEYAYLLGIWLHANMFLCHWEAFQTNISQLVQRIQESKKTSPPFPTLAFIDDPAIQRQAAEIWMHDKYPLNPALGEIPKRARQQKLRVGYFSADFREHAVAYLTAELFESHDKNMFSIIAFYTGPLDSSAMQQRLSTAFDQFIHVQHKTDEDVASLARRLEIDIAVDLTGLTKHSRPGIFALRAAPIQASYIGYLGTMGASYYDYLIADQTIVPNDHHEFFTEKIVYLPSYQINDTQRKISNRTFSDEELHIPSNSFIFCTFNSTYKITPQAFTSWMQILLAVPSSVLFLLAESDQAQNNLSKQAILHGVEPHRLVFAHRIAREDYLARYRRMGLFLDTHPYNAGTTASDALWAGLPVLTLIGKSFASRIAASVLQAIELPELITTSWDEYVTTAIDLANHPNKLNAIKTRLAATRSSSALFNAGGFTRCLEAAYLQMYERYQSDLPPDHIYVHLHKADI